MNKTAIKNFSINARKKLIENISQKAYELGITENEMKEIETFEGGFRVKGTDIKRTIKYYSPEKVDRIIVEKRNDLIERIIYKGFDQVIEEVAYTWFNRFIALKFMEANDYLPTGVRVLSSEDETIEPDIIKEALNIDLDIDREIVYNLQDNNETDDLYKYLLIKQCNKLGEIMPTVFEEIADYTELLIPDKLLAEGSVIRDLVESIDEEDYKEQVEIIGWMYQYYISEKKDEVFAGLKKNKKITKENIPAATQLFTPKWIVKYMVENSLGRLWLESHPDEELQKEWKYYLEEAEQDKEVQEKLDELKNPNLNPEDIKILDPAMGSGHILVYAFDVLYDIYSKVGYQERKIPQLILEKNIYGLDIDDRAAQLATFALFMKARSKNRRIFRREINLNVCSIQESNGIEKEAIEFFADGDEKLKEDVDYLVHVFEDAKEYGSILNVEKVDFDSIEERLEEIKNENVEMFNQGYRNVILEQLPEVIKQGRIMSSKYDVVCTNPPYMGRKGMNGKLSSYLRKYYKHLKNDLFAVFIEKCIEMCKKERFVSTITQHSWMFLSSYELLREKIIDTTEIQSMAHLGSKAFDEIGGEVVQTATFVLRKNIIEGYKGVYSRLIDFSKSSLKKEQFLKKNFLFIINKEKFKKIPGMPIAYWVSDKTYKIYDECIYFSEIAHGFQGMITGDNNYFLRKWYEISNQNLMIGYSHINEAKNKINTWVPYKKGGGHRKWFGNNKYVLRWENDGLNLTRARTENKKYYLREGITWSYISTSEFSALYFEEGYLWDVASSSIFIDDNKYSLFELLGIMNSSVIKLILNITNATLNFQLENILDLPYINLGHYSTIIESYVKQNIEIAKKDWDSLETSWNFNEHPILNHKIKNSNLYYAFNQWKHYTENQFNQLKYNEEELNRIFIDIYGLQEELTPEVEDKDITIRKADRERDIKSFISYAVGCMFGRYSLDEEGLIFAGGEFDIDRYEKFKPVKDNIIPITSDDYFEEDIVSRFVYFLEITFGKDTLEENLEYIAETIGKKSSETSRQAIRNYFLKKSGFYKDHVRTYSKTPIYWMFDSGKQDGFKALIYMHRYDPLLVARVRIDYLHELQGSYEAEINRLDTLINSDTAQTREKSQSRKQIDKVSKQLEECRKYDQVINHIANRRIDIDLDDGVKVNYAKFQKVEVPMGEGKKSLKEDLLAKL